MRSFDVGGPPAKETVDSDVRAHAATWGNLVNEVRHNNCFRSEGYLAGRVGDVDWIVIDPWRHPLRVWSSDRYDSPGGVVAATNGPMMGRSLAAIPLRRSTMALAVGLAGVTAGGCMYRGRHRRLASLSAAMIAGAFSFRGLLMGWAPCGSVCSLSSNILDRRDFRREGRDHAWFGRSGLEFGCYRIGLGNPPPDIVEGCGGLVRIVVDGVIAREFGDARRLADKHPAVGWGLIGPFTEETKSGVTAKGLLVIVATPNGRVADVAHAMVSLGARDAVCTDPSASAMASWGTVPVIGPPRAHRRAIQIYGLCCDSSAAKAG